MSPAGSPKAAENGRCGGDALQPLLFRHRTGVLSVLLFVDLQAHQPQSFEPRSRVGDALVECFCSSLLFLSST